jgi:ubiquinone/menaquinone biosynthesis C-methylase UbiE
MLAKTRFLAQQHGMALGLGLVTRALHTVLRRRRPGPSAADLAALRRRFDDLLARDWSCAERGIYPKELLFRVHMREHLRALPAVAADLPRVLRRIRRRQTDDLPAGIDRSRYPDYYLRNFHWQTDGWLSERSARMYDVGVDILFGGATDVMRRMALPPVVEAVRGQRRARILDVACGTGRFLEMLRAALPEAQLHGVDLSPFYVARARRRRIGDVTLGVENAEALPFRDDWFDAVTIVFLFHELPRDARRRVLAEARRVLKPGGVVSVLDSAQLSDAGELRFFLEAFHRMYHEPYYKGYLGDDLEGALIDVGLAARAVEPCFVAKLVVGQKPAA